VIKKIAFSIPFIENLEKVLVKNRFLERMNSNLTNAIITEEDICPLENDSGAESFKLRWFLADWREGIKR
jgi:hypothetical protein